MIFPIWFFYIIPIGWLYILPGNFIIDSIVLLITLKLIHCTNIKDIYKKSILKVWIFGFIADFLGVGLIFCTSFIRTSWWNNNILSPISANPWTNIFASIFILFFTALVGVAIYFFNYKISFKNVDLPKNKKFTLALSLAILTAPYTLLIPTSFLYKIGVYGR